MFNAAASAAPVLDVVKDTDTVIEPAKAWAVKLWDDPVTPMDYVSHTLQKILLVDRVTAEHLMLTAHNDGHAIVFHGIREAAEAKVAQFHTAVLNASLVEA